MNLVSQDINRIIRRLPKGLLDVIKNNNLYLAGGFIRSIIANEPVVDIDLFLSPESNIDKVRAELTGVTGDSSPYMTEFANTFIGASYPIQLITKWRFGSADNVLKHFDFRCCQAVIWADTTIHANCNESFYSDVAAKRLYYTDPINAEAGASLLRMLKYSRKGYNIAPSCLAALIARFCMMYTGIGKSFDRGHLAYVFNGLLREIDPNTADHSERVEEETKGVLVSPMQADEAAVQAQEMANVGAIGDKDSVEQDIPYSAESEHTA